MRSPFFDGTERFCNHFRKGCWQGEAPDFRSDSLRQTFQEDSPHRLFSYVVPSVSCQGGEVLDVGVYVDPFKSQIFQLLPSLRISLGVQESPFEGVQEVIPSLRGLVRLFIYFCLFLYERVYFLPLDQGHGEGHSPFVRVKRGDSLVEA